MGRVDVISTNLLTVYEVLGAEIAGAQLSPN